ASSAWFPSSFRSHSKRFVFLFYHHSGCLFHSGFLALTRDQEAQREDSPESSRCPGFISNLHGSRVGPGSGDRASRSGAAIKPPRIERRAYADQFRAARGSSPNDCVEVIRGSGGPRECAFLCCHEKYRPHRRLSSLQQYNFRYEVNKKWTTLH